MPPTDPDDVEVNQNSIYIIIGNGKSAGETPFEVGAGEPRMFHVQKTGRGIWERKFIELDRDEDDLAERLAADDGNERLTPDEFAQLLGERPEFEYLRVNPVPRVADKVVNSFPDVERVSVEEIPGTEAGND